jgi:predicted dinucleotide-binding enzyme
MGNKLAWKADIGVLGTGRMGVRLAEMFARAGRSVILGSRDSSRSEAIARSLDLPNLRSGTYCEAVRAGAVMPAVFIRDGLLDLLDCRGSDLSNKLLIDISNPFNEDYSDFITPWDTSGAEEIQRRLPQARVVGAFKNVFWGVFDSPRFGETVSDVLATGDDPSAKAEFFKLAQGTPFRYLDAGPLINSRTVERLTLITSRVGRALDSYPAMNWRLLTQPQVAAA